MKQTYARNILGWRHSIDIDALYTFYLSKPVEI